jgi:hypothetical protein
MTWPSVAQLAVALSHAGFDVHAVAPSKSPVHVLGCVATKYRLKIWSVAKSLTSAIELVRADLLIPCDDPARAHMEALARHRPDFTVIAKALGRESARSIIVSRDRLIELARTKGISAPETASLANRAALAQWLEHHDSPAVVKTDGSWGGLGTRIAENREDAVAAFRALSNGRSWLRSIKRAILDQDTRPLRRRLGLDKPVISVQRYVDGTPGNIAVACWNGEVIASIAVKALCTATAIGPATIVRVVDSPDMARAASILVAELGLSGICGFDFIVDSANRAHLIEFNPRATPTAHLALGPAHDLAHALRAQFPGAPLSPPRTVSTNPVIALFPQALVQDADNPLLASAYLDEPHDSPELKAHGLEKIAKQQRFTRRGGLGRLSTPMRVDRYPTTRRR